MTRRHGDTPTRRKEHGTPLQGPVKVSGAPSLGSARRGGYAADLRCAPSLGFARGGGYTTGLRTTLARFATIAGFVVLCSAAIEGCNHKDAQKQSAGTAAVEKTTERGPVRMVVRVDKGKTTIAEKVHLTIEVVAEEGVDVEMPSFGDKLNEFEIRDFHERSSVPIESADNGKKERSWSQDYVLETYLSGEQEIPAITAKFHDKRNPAKLVDGEVTSEPFKIEVASLLAGQFNPAKFKDIKGTVELPVEHNRKWMWWAGGGAITATIAAAAMGWLISRKRRVAVRKETPAHEWAFFALQRLEEDRLIEAGLVQEFYFRLSSIVREYIERRFGLMAPERTTPEFLAEMQANSLLSRDHKGLLGEFLQAADMVKFARYEPAGGEVSEALGTARAFVEQTTPHPGSEAEETAATMEVSA